MVANSDVVNGSDQWSIPKWINADYFEEILQKNEPDYESVLNFSAEPAIPPGENFTSVMLRINMDLKLTNGLTKRMTYVLKTQLAEEKGGKILIEMQLFPKELEMYQKYIPAFEALYKAAGKDIQLAPKCLHTEQTADCINFVFEDLSERQFRNVDRMKGFDMAHMKRVLHKLAEFHATSAVFVEQNGPLPDCFNNGFLSQNEKVQLQKHIFRTREKVYKNAMTTWGLENAEYYIQKFPTVDQYWKCCQSALKGNPNSFHVLTHGDFWSSNIMQNYLPDGSIDDMIIVDYQFCKWGVPADDLLFFITISAAKDIRIKEFDHFVQIYHSHLVDCLKLLKYQKPLPKLRELQAEMYMEHTSFYAFFAVFNHLIVTLMPTDKESNVDSLLREDEVGEKYRMRCLTNPLFVEAMRELFPFFHRRGIFNFEDYDNMNND